MNKIAIEIAVIFLLLLLNGLLAMAEIAIVSARKLRLQQMAEEGQLSAQAALMLAAAPNQFLATVQIGITLVGILAGAFGGATIADEIADLLEQIPFLAPYANTIGIALVVLVISYFSLVLGELVPKRLGLNNPEAIAVRVAWPMQLLSRLAAPLVRLLSASTDLVLRLLGARPSLDPPITEEELKGLLEQGAQSGIIEASEQDMIEGVLRLDERSIGALMIPRTQIVAFDIEDSLDDIRPKIADTRYSRFPVVQDNLDNVLGFMYAKDLLNQTLAGKPFDLRALLRPPLFVPESMSALRVLDILKQSRSNIALVADEYGGVEGLVTHNDILEMIAGAIPTGDLSAEPQAVRREDGTWLLDGLLPIDDLKELLAIERLPDEERSRYYTVGGFVMNQAGSIPTAGYSFVWNDLYFEVMDMDGLRVDKVLVALAPPNHNNAEGARTP